MTKQHNCSSYSLKAALYCTWLANWIYPACWRLRWTRKWEVFEDQTSDWCSAGHFKPNTSFICNSQEKTLSQMPLDFAPFYTCLVNKPIDLFQRNKHAIVSPNLWMVVYLRYTDHKEVLECFIVTQGHLPCCTSAAEEDVCFLHQTELQSSPHYVCHSLSLSLYGVSLHWLVAL